MLAADLNRGAARLHDGLVAATSSTLVLRLAHLHRPIHGDPDGPSCRGCDADSAAAGEPVWPCRTYALLAEWTLHVRDLESQIAALGRTSTQLR